MRSAKIVLAILVPIVLAAALSGCGTYYEYDESPGAGISSPPPWEAERGLGTTMHYYYYPQVKIYYNLEREVYFYHYEGQWQVASQLPSNVKVSGRRVTLEMGEEEPFKWQGEVEKRYPPEPEGEEEK